MNCNQCGEEIENGRMAVFVCDSCFNEFMLLELTADEKRGAIPVDPMKAVRLLLFGYTLYGPKGNAVMWSDDEKGFVTDGNNPFTGFGKLYYTKQKQNPDGHLDTFECLVWVNSPESQGWMVRRKYIGHDVWEEWDIPQRFKYDGMEEYADHGVISYQRARVLPDKSGVDESTIQGFLKEV